MGDIVVNDTVETIKKHLVGTSSYDNWRAFDDGKPWLTEQEYLLYSDAYFSGEITDGLGPYRLFNLVPADFTTKVRATVALRVSFHIELDTPLMGKTEQSRYHGGWITDEIAAMVSLLCGVRLRPTGVTRWFTKGGDPQGKPLALQCLPEPVINIGVRGPVLPRVIGQHTLDHARMMHKFPLLKPEQAIVLIRAVRLYQEALWVAESDANQSWLLLVAAIETAANYWRASKDPPIERLKISRPVFFKFLIETGIDGLAEKVAVEFVDSIGSTKKFTEFLLEFLPAPPEKRPHEKLQVIWTEHDLKKAFKLIYDYRSKALHDGRPFPFPMCDPPFMPNRKDPTILAEKPLGLATSASGGTWVSIDTPMLLNTFEYIVRNVLIKWWMSMAE